MRPWILLVLVVAGVWRPTAARADEAAALARIDALHGIVERDPAFPGNPVVQVSLQATAATDADLQVLRELKELRRLYLGYGTRTTDAGLAHVGKLLNLEVLALPETAVTDAGLAHLKPLSHLQKLGLLNCKRITDAGLVHLRGLKSLRDVSFSGTRVTERGVAELQKLLPQAYLSGGRREVPPGYPTRAERRSALAKAHPGLPPEMLEFLSLFDATEQGTETALARFRAPEADVTDLVAVLLEHPRVTRTERQGARTCYTVVGKQGQATGTYRVCWKGKKIQSIQQMALRFSGSRP
jgi:hypothetical protein